MMQYKGHSPKPQFDFLLTTEEMPGTPPADAATTDIAERNADLNVRELIEAEEKRERRDRLPELAPVEQAPMPVRPARSVKKRLLAARLPQIGGQLV